MAVATVTRRLTFNAAHRVHNPALSDEDNARLFGKCNNPNWHGHNYVLEVSVRGEVDSRTGYVVDLGNVKSVVQAAVIDLVDHKNLNIEVDFMQGVIPTTENLAIAFWKVLAPHFAPASLLSIRLQETENHWVEYRGE